ncbi:nitrile hydratase accessory protein [uncultured Ruegeria sp.]|uniref:nitrile hydratase accessory protein n=1 Tax=uncultured Ruegeria sp. TaxID=259304 RepID=UPI002610E172|nr:nitrile hydratase accessory protein [uncultured Ruegeria sp.]
MTTVDLRDLPGLTLDGEEPVFNEPWEAQAFAMVINLHENGAFTWAEWADALSVEIHSGKEMAYYHHWLAALEKIVSAKSLISANELAVRKDAWHRAADATPHGEPILLSAGLPD